MTLGYESGSPPLGKCAKRIAPARHAACTKENARVATFAARASTSRKRWVTAIRRGAARGLHLGFARRHGSAHRISHDRPAAAARASAYTPSQASRTALAQRGVLAPARHCQPQRRPAGQALGLGHFAIGRRLHRLAQLRAPAYVHRATTRLPHPTAPAATNPATAGLSPPASRAISGPPCAPA